MDINSCVNDVHHRNPRPANIVNYQSRTSVSQCRALKLHLNERMCCQHLNGNHNPWPGRHANKMAMADMHHPASFASACAHTPASSSTATTARTRIACFRHASLFPAQVLDRRWTMTSGAAVYSHSGLTSYYYFVERVTLVAPSSGFSLCQQHIRGLDSLRSYHSSNERPRTLKRKFHYNFEFIHCTESKVDGS